jgi:hypothetical protein
MIEVRSPLPTAEARVRARVRSCGICGGQCGTGAGFLRVLRFPLSVIPPIAPNSSSSSGTGTICQIVADVPSGPCLTSPQETKKKIEKSRSLRLFGRRNYEFVSSRTIVWPWWRTESYPRSPTECLVYLLYEIGTAQLNWKGLKQSLSNCWNVWFRKVRIQIS